jgi:hypothetical protein
MEISNEVKSEIQRQIKVVMSDPRFFGTKEQAEQIVLENAGFTKVEDDGMKIR